MVRLKEITTAAKRLRIDVFQFQNGSIKRKETAKLAGYYRPFQFQNGSIKSPLDYQTGHFDGGFNSKMVRLKEKRPLRTRTGFSVSIPKWFD